jgi:hypothetical protein
MQICYPLATVPRIVRLFVRAVDSLQFWILITEDWHGGADGLTIACCLQLMNFIGRAPPPQARRLPGAMPEFGKILIKRERAKCGAQRRALARYRRT